MQGQLREALIEARRSLELDPTCIDCRVTLATIYIFRSEYNLAEPELLTVLEQDENNPFAQNNLASTYLHLGRPGEAEPLARSAAQNEMYVGRHLAFYNLGWSLYERRRYDEALEAFAQALREQPRMCTAHYRIALIYLRQSRYEDAIHHIEQAITEPDDEVPRNHLNEEENTCSDMPDVFHVLGMAMLALSRQEEAQAAFSRCVELAGPRHPIYDLCEQHRDEQE